MKKKINIKDLLHKSLNCKLESLSKDEKIDILYEEVIDLDSLQDNVFSFYDNTKSFIYDSKKKIDDIEKDFTKINNSQVFYYGPVANNQHKNLFNISQHLDQILNLNFFDNPGAILKTSEKFNEILLQQKHKIRIAFINEAVSKINNQNIKKDEREDMITIYDDEISTILSKETNKHQDSIITKLDDEIGFSYENTPYKTTITYHLQPSDSDYNQKKYLVKTVNTYYCSEFANDNNYSQVEEVILYIEKESGLIFLPYNVSKIVSYNG